jgi:UDP-N-acetylmuramoyl-L-alanyl-D-glutamate--2,6-diaminopimelate ligase
MLNQMKNLGRSIIPKALFKALQPIYHGFMALVASMVYGNPSQDLTVIGVTGTAGKSTTVIMLSHILNSSGFKTGYITTAGSFDGNNTITNTQGLSMPGGWMLQQSLHKFVSNGCKFAIIEATSEGLAQNRHLGINFTGALFTNLAPAHLDSHGSFENYRAAKGRLFASLISDSFIGVNADDANFQFFLNFPARRKFGTSVREDKIPQASIPIVRAEKIEVADNLKFTVEDQQFEINLKGSFNIANALLAITAAQYLNIPLFKSSEALKTFGSVPGRMETIPNNLGITIIIDYAPEPSAMEQSLRAVSMLDHNKIIHVFGSTGGHRDVSKRFEFGKISSKFADTIIITNDDVYDSDPEEIAKNISEGISRNTDNKKASEVITVLDRKEAMKKSLEIAKPGDVILITGKGNEQFLSLPGNIRIEWEDAKVMKELLDTM